ncbi:MAG: hypothetical protein Ct9H90mP9_2610 [Pseudomonadota bacterium]|nr:MAG: hypothetical protein Ct9H90mP9_2610 [Pseudomonadota bacterium]
MAGIARQGGNEHLTFSPIVSSVTIGSGLHVHFSLQDLEGRERNSIDGARISVPAGAFLAGILGNLPSLTAFNSPSLISAERYSPPRWTAYFNNLGMMDRRAAIPITRLGSGSPNIHFELRRRTPVPALTWCSVPWSMPESKD